MRWGSKLNFVFACFSLDHFTSTLSSMDTVPRLLFPFLLACLSVLVWSHVLLASDPITPMRPICVWIFFSFPPPLAPTVSRSPRSPPHIYMRVLGHTVAFIHVCSSLHSSPAQVFLVRSSSSDCLVFAFYLSIFLSCL